MFEIYTVSFFGHRRLERLSPIEKQLEPLIKELIDTKEYVEFLVGRNGEFDLLVSSTICRIKHHHRSDNSSHTLVLPYETAEYRDNIDSFHNYYDNIESLYSFRKTHFKGAIQERNRQMVDRSDLVVFYLERAFGGAYQTDQYALKQQKNIVKLKTGTA